MTVPMTAPTLAGAFSQVMVPAAIQVILTSPQAVATVTAVGSWGM
jgi:hypothetical protein